ncbi:hypothetical protein Nepgr_028745 [Nepenthes gracilis]|uniref:Uncharacterized protein n=1 Tax=Nepenthes gracilis TaxID=150966 RepID=A0AAD3TCM4_NEPGR|nr:hypothetical protein Nepgr_028745 [Nepenthes gracilis]
MSKKKAFSGSTMTLKDFHGGSIPSDIPLPSAPGVIVRPSDRPGYDRQTSWGNAIGRSDHRLRPNSSGSMRNFDDKTPFLINSVHIGRNFDEDERKPLDGVSGPRRTVSDESIVTLPMSVEPKQDTGRFSGQQGSVLLPQSHGPTASSYAARVVEEGHTGVGSTTLSSYSGQAVNGPFPNAWTVRKAAMSAMETSASALTGQNTVSKFAQASALDKVSSGRWQTTLIHHQADAERIKHSELQSNLHPMENDAYSGINLVNEREYYETNLAMHTEKGLAIEDQIQSGAKELLGSERAWSPVSYAKERKFLSYSNGGLPANPENKYGNPELQTLTEASERPRLKLLPRTKPVDISEPTAVDYKQGFRQPSEISQIETGNELYGQISHTKPGLSGCEAGNWPVERPRLNLKPRSQPLEQSEERAERERMALFGGARPRELVLKERNIHDVATNDDPSLPSRIKNDLHANPLRVSEKSDNVSIDQRVGKVIEKRDRRGDADKPDLQGKNQRNENWRNSRDAEKHHQHLQERTPSPDTWRKPVEQPKPTNSDVSGPRFGKAVSAVELAQAFSRSGSDPKSTDQSSGPRGLLGRTQMPFSRLTGPATRPQINGY